MSNISEEDIKVAEEYANGYSTILSSVVGAYYGYITACEVKNPIIELLRAENEALRKQVAELYGTPF